LPYFITNENILSFQMWCVWVFSKLVISKTSVQERENEDWRKFISFNLECGDTRILLLIWPNRLNFRVKNITPVILALRRGAGELWVSGQPTLKETLSQIIIIATIMMMTVMETQMSWLSYSLSNASTCIHTNFRVFVYDN
jgi:hypothetical protein